VSLECILLRRGLLFRATSKAFGKTKDMPTDLVVFLFCSFLFSSVLFFSFLFVCFLVLFLLVLPCSSAFVLPVILLGLPQKTR
jgi:heme/copper-type cytochrome/quinol oxidase subunit 3